MQATDRETRSEFRQYLDREEVNFDNIQKEQCIQTRLRQNKRDVKQLSDRYMIPIQQAVMEHVYLDILLWSLASVAVVEGCSGTWGKASSEEVVPSGSSSYKVCTYQYTNPIPAGIFPSTQLLQ